MEPEMTLERRLWTAVEPIHAVVYFAPEPAAAAKAMGLRGWWMGYFAGRLAPLGPIGPAPSTAMLFGFEPAMVAKALPDAWSYAPPEVVLRTRVEAAAEALRSVLGAPALGAAGPLADLLWDAVDGCDFDARPMAAAWASVARPADPVAALWVATTILREHRGDGHVLAAVAAGLGGLEATLTMVASGTVGRDRIQPHRGWTDLQWEAAVDELRDSGVLAPDGGLTTEGHALRRRVEALTDQLAHAPVHRLGADRLARVIELAAPLSRAVIDAGVVPVPNPIGVPRP